MIAIFLTNKEILDSRLECGIDEGYISDNSYKWIKGKEKKGFYYKEDKTMNNTIACYDFRIIRCQDGSEIIDEKLKTPLDSIDGVLAAEYQKVQDALDIIHKKEKKRQKEASAKQKKERNILFKIACLCGLITA